MVWGIPLYLPQNNSICPDLPPFASQPNPVSGLMAEGCSEVCPELDLMYNCRRNKCLSSVHSLAHTVLTTFGYKAREGFPFFVLQTEEWKQKPFLLPQHPYQGPPQTSHWYRWLQESLVLLFTATATDLPSTRHGWLYTNPWKQKPQTSYTTARAGTMHKPLQVLESSDDMENSSPFPQVVKEFWAGAQNTRLLLYSSLKWHFLFPYSSPAVFMGRSSSTFPL